MEISEADMATVLVDSMGEMITLLIDGHVLNDRVGHKTRSETSTMLIGLGNYAAFAGREDLRRKLYAFSDKAGQVPKSPKT